MMKSITTFFAALTLLGSAAFAQQFGPAPWAGYHYGPNKNFDNQGNYLPGAYGFNIADVGTDKATVDALPDGVWGAVWWGKCDGATAEFQSMVNSFIGDSKFAFVYLMDEPQYSQCSVANLKAEADYIYSKLGPISSFIVLYNYGSPENPQYSQGSDSYANADVQMIGLDPYPCRPEWSAQPNNGCKYSVITASVNEAIAEGYPVYAANGHPTGQVIPVYQTFGGGTCGNLNCYGGPDGWTMPTTAQENMILSTWRQAGITIPDFDMTYSYGVQNADVALSGDPALLNLFQALFASEPITW